MRVVAWVVGAVLRDGQKWWRLGGAWQTPGEVGAGAEGERCPYVWGCLGTFGDGGALPLPARRGCGTHAGGMGLGGCCGIRRVIPAGPSSLPVPLAPAQPPASAELRRSRRDGSRWLRAIVSLGRRGYAGARSAPPCSAPASSTRPRWRARAASWATCTARGARRASRPAPPGPSAAAASQGQVGAMGLPREGLRGGSRLGAFWRGGGCVPGKFAASALPTPAWGCVGPEPPRVVASLSLPSPC